MRLGLTRPFAAGRHSDRDVAGTALVFAVAALAGALVALLGLRGFAFTDYEVEALPALQRLVAGDLHGFLDLLPGYGGATVLQAPFALLGHQVGGDAELWSWRAQAIPGFVALIVVGIASGLSVRRALPGRAGLAWGAVTAALIGGAPFALLALQTGHTEELLVSGAAVGAVLLATHDRVLLASALVGAAAAAKPWAVIAVPVVLLAATDRRRLVRAGVVCVLAAGVVLAPTTIGGGADRVAASTHASTSGIFKPTNVFWFFGERNPRWIGLDAQQAGPEQLFQTDPARAGWAQRLEPSWAARLSHPAIVAFAALVALGVALARRRRPGAFAPADLLLALATVCWWRCLLDTWNVHYYALTALVALAAWEARRGRPPVLALVVTAAAWTQFQLLPSTTTPDQKTALYLAWALPVGLALVWRTVAPASAVLVGDRVSGVLRGRLPTLARAVGAAPRPS